MVSCCDQSRGARWDSNLHPCFCPVFVFCGALEVYNGGKRSACYVFAKCAELIEAKKGGNLSEAASYISILFGGWKMVSAFVDFF